jgi:hypothetical protein
MNYYASPFRFRLILASALLLAVGNLRADRAPGAAPDCAPGEAAVPAKGGDATGKAPFTTPPSVDPANLREGVQITELGKMRLLLVLSPEAADVDKLVKQRFSDVHFRVFPSSVQLTEDELSPRELHEMGNDRFADFVVHVQTTSRLRNKLGNLALHEAETTVTAYSPLSEEILAIHTSRVDGERLADPIDAQRSAREKSADTAVGEAIAKMLEKAQKSIVLEAVFHDIKNHVHLLSVIKYVEELDGVYHVRQMKFDSESGDAIIEIIAAPRTENYWRAHLESWPDAEGKAGGKKPVKFNRNKQLREAYGDWFAE